MDVALLFLPLVGGYIFAKTWLASSYAVARTDGHRLYFHSAFYAPFLFLCAVLLRSFLHVAFLPYREFESEVASLVMPFLKDPDKTYQVPLTFVCTYALALAWPMAALLNLIRHQDKWVNAAVRKSNDDVEILLHECLRSIQPIFLSMENRKVYVGFVVKTVEPTDKRKTISILPLVSGYRDTNTLSVNFTTDYERIYPSPDRPPELSHLDVKDFVMVLPADKVNSMHVFDLAAFSILRGVPVSSARSHPNSSSSIAGLAARKEDLMAQKPLSQTLRPKALEAMLASLKAERGNIKIRQDTKREAGVSTDDENSRIAELDAEIARVEKELKGLT